MSLLLAFDDEAALAQRLARESGWRLAFVDRHRFPDGETRLRLPPSLPERVALLRGLQQPNEKLAELMLAAGGARELGARHLVLASPYLAYMRQDIAFVPGEVVSQRHLGRALAAWFDAVVTVDPHLHRVSSMDQVVPGSRGIALSAAPLLGEWVAGQVPGALLLGPDEESLQWVRAAAEAHGLAFAVCRKRRHADREVEVELPGVDLRGRAVVLLDDVASTGRTLVEAARGALARGAASVDVAVTHALMVGDAMAELKAAGVRHVWSTDSVPHESNAVSIAPMLARALSAPG
ncbi:ribose-phosphate diphosphokinase [Burkholderiaceae bacterium FT117]|uniref:ribose-phosphate diphosphokinase n=1 Tax=Zeimonas sediminis TaxID=2944268 RepID=UPI002342EB62|nr:ribose-phosphate diphosphokinase [Zeimonas sediminis]MCM5571245.1 ribose-phosphate diphosphokinase [Zeimonas sediminis]